MKKRIVIAIAVVLAIACIFRIAILHRVTSVATIPAVTALNNLSTPVANAARPQESLAVTPASLPVNPNASSNAAAETTVIAKLSAAPAGQSLTINGYVVQDPDARLALSLVGTDPDAEDYWVQAINDPNLPAEERKDLIEDLNEDGLSDPKHPAPEDMPIIAGRIQLIEELASSAMDQVNADALAEAHKDLVNLLNGIPSN